MGCTRSQEIRQQRRVERKRRELSQKFWKATKGAFASAFLISNGVSFVETGQNMNRFYAGDTAYTEIDSSLARASAVSLHAIAGAIEANIQHQNTVFFNEGCHEFSPTGNLPSPLKEFHLVLGMPGAMAAGVLFGTQRGLAETKEGNQIKAGMCARPK